MIRSFLFLICILFSTSCDSFKVLSFAFVDSETKMPLTNVSLFLVTEEVTGVMKEGVFDTILYGSNGHISIKMTDALNLWGMANAPNYQYKKFSINDFHLLEDNEINMVLTLERCQKEDIEYHLNTGFMQSKESTPYLRVRLNKRHEKKEIIGYDFTNKKHCSKTNCMDIWIESEGKINNWGYDKTFLNISENKEIASINENILNCGNLDLNKLDYRSRVLIDKSQFGFVVKGENNYYILFDFNMINSKYFPNYYITYDNYNFFEVGYIFSLIHFKNNLICSSCIKPTLQKSMYSGLFGEDFPPNNLPIIRNEK